jgi:hypothetical protein
MPAHKEYREHWVNADYERAMGSAWVRLCTLQDRSKASPRVSTTM